MQYAFISDQPAKPYDQFVLEVLGNLADNNVQGIAIIALNDDSTYSQYWNMNYTDKCKAESTIRSDVFDALILANKERYSACADCQNFQEDTDEIEQ